MSEETFKITEENQQRLIIDLLIRVTVENEVQRMILFTVFSGGYPQKLREKMDLFGKEYKEKSLQLKKIIFANYGHVDLNDLLSGDTI
jgi:hypothetical protein